MTLEDINTAKSKPSIDLKEKMSGLSSPSVLLELWLLTPISLQQKANDVYKHLVY